MRKWQASTRIEPIMVLSSGMRIGKYEGEVMRNQFCLVILFIVVCLSVKSVSAIDGQVPIVDGIIFDDEYSQSIVEPSTKIEVHWFNNEVHLWIGLRSPGLGWVAIGFEPEAPRHKGADLIIGYVKNEQLFIQDGYGVDPLSHESDEILGGTYDILESAGSESEGKTSIEFKIPLNSNDAFDKIFEPNNNYTTILAYQATADDLISPHTAMGTTMIETIPEFPSFLIFQLFMIATLLTVIIKKRKSCHKEIS